ncbi:MAG: AAA family ATPase, partial [Hyphomicrobiaceae bacterium]
MRASTLFACSDPLFDAESAFLAELPKSLTSVPVVASQAPLTGLADIAWPAGVKATWEFDLAYQHLKESDGNLFVTGRAGTGKSTLLRALRDLISEDVVVVAPTGLAAVNVGGQTIHSFFGLPPRLVRGDDIKRSRNGRIMRRMK